MCLLSFFTTFVSEHLILRRIMRDTIINVHKSSYFINRFPKNTRISVFMKICPVGAELIHVDGQTDCMKLAVAFCNFVNASKN